jgi:hypothetical protein
MTIRRELGWCQPKRGRELRYFFAFRFCTAPDLYRLERMPVVYFH